MVLVCSLSNVNLSAPGNRDLRRVSRRQPLRASRLRWTSPFHLTGNFNILTLDHFRLLCWSRCDRASWKADVKIWVATLAICPSRCRVPSRSKCRRSLICCGNLLKTRAYKNDVQLLPKELDAKVKNCTFQHSVRNYRQFEEQAAFRARCQTVHRDRGLLPESSRTRGARWATVLRHRGLLPESSRTRGPINSKWKSRAQVVREFPQSPQGRLRQPPPFRNAPVPQGRLRNQRNVAQKPWGGPPSCDLAPLTTSFGTVGQWERRHRAMVERTKGRRPKNRPSDTKAQKPTSERRNSRSNLGARGGDPRTLASWRH